MKIYILYENHDWLAPLVKELQKADLPYEEWFLHQGQIDLQSKPPEGIFLNRISPSSHTRDHLDSIYFNRQLLYWLEAHGKRVINGSHTFALETSKVLQYVALEKAGLQTPKTIAVCGGVSQLKEAARKMALPFITKHNCGGKGIGVQLFNTYEAFDAAADSLMSDPPIDHIMLLQAYIKSPQKMITRVEIVNEEFLYAITSDTSHGFELCPAESCAIGSAFCPTTETATQNTNRQSLFKLRHDFNDPIIHQYIKFMQANRIDIAGIEFIEDKHGNKITYDINCTTNYSPGVEEQHGLNGMRAVVKFLERELWFFRI